MSSGLSGPILIVEDDGDIREALQGFLEMEGYEVLTARHGREALEHMKGQPRPSLIVLDMALPVMDGHRVLAARKETEGLQEVPVIILSAGMALMNARDRALYATSYTVSAFLKKPADPKQLVDLIERLALRPAADSAGAPA